MAVHRIDEQFPFAEFGKNSPLTDRLVFMADGKVAETGKPKSLFENPRTLRLQDFLKNANI